MVSRASLALIAVFVASCGAEEQTIVERIDISLSRAARFVAERQDEDGAWRSETYGTLKDGLSLTPAVLKVLLYAPVGDDYGEGIARAIAYLTSVVRSDGSIDPGPYGFVYPVYTSSLAVIALSYVKGGTEGERDAWLALLLSHQLTEELGWTPDDPAYGGWGYSLEPPRKDDPERTYDSDLSSTLFALGALKLTGRGADDPAVRKALGFVTRCQNFTEAGADARFDDGGFFFTPSNDLQNKAGVAGTGSAGRRRYRSYGSMTADGLRALLRCGLDADHPRVAAARAWLLERFDPASNPGDYETVREIERDSAYYYYAWSLAHALHASSTADPSFAGVARERLDDLAEEILSRQNPDGSWVNRLKIVKEDDPLIATSFAAAVLGLCKMERLRAPPGP